MYKATLRVYKNSNYFNAQYLTTQLIHISKKLNEYKDSNVHYSVTVHLS